MNEIDKINNIIKVNKKSKTISTKEISDGIILLENYMSIE